MKEVKFPLYINVNEINFTIAISRVVLSIFAFPPNNLQYYEILVFVLMRLHGDHYYFFVEGQHQNHQEI